MTINKRIEKKVNQKTDWVFVQRHLCSARMKVKRYRTYKKNSGIWSWAFVLCIVSGKIAGGLLYDSKGPLKTVAISLLSGTILFFFSGIPVLGCAAVLLFNMTMPVTLCGAANAVHDMPGFMFGLLTMALFIGFIPVYADCSVPVRPLLCAALCLITLVLLIPAFQRRRT